MVNTTIQATQEPPFPDVGALQFIPNGTASLPSLGVGIGMILEFHILPLAFRGLLFWWESISCRFSMFSVGFFC